MQRLFIMTGLPIIPGTSVRAPVIDDTLLGLPELNITPVAYGLLTAQNVRRARYDASASEALVKEEPWNRPLHAQD